MSEGSDWREWDLAGLSPEQRTALRRRLAELEPLPAASPSALKARRLVLELLVVSCLVLIPWIVLLAITLPRRYSAAHWSAAWVGFDVLTSASRVDRITALASALLVELPLALGLFAIARRFILLTLWRTWAGLDAPPRVVLHRVPLFMESP